MQREELKAVSLQGGNHSTSMAEKRTSWEKARSVGATL